MTREKDLRRLRTERNSAKAQFDEHLAQVRQELTVRGLGERLADKVSVDARALYEQSTEIASESKGIVAGTIATLALWLFRHPIIAMYYQHFHHENPVEQKQVSTDET